MSNSVSAIIYTIYALKIGGSVSA